MNPDLEDLKKQATVDNSRLEEIMKKEITPESQSEFLEIFKDSQLFMPVAISDNVFEAIENTKPGDVLEPAGQVGFDINYLKGKDGTKAVPLFTSSEIMELVGFKSSVIGIFMSDLADILSQSDRYSAIVVNPFTELDISIPIEAFLDIFEEISPEQKELLNALKETYAILSNHSVELEENTTLFIRADENFMIENAVDGIYTPTVPFYVSSNPEYGEEFKYTNILLMPKSKRILPIGPDNELDIIIAPGTEFKLQDTMDGTQNLWMCGEQPFYKE